MIKRRGSRQRLGIYLGMDRSGFGFRQRAFMKHEQLVELARLWRMAQEYQEKAARLDSGKRPDIGDKPSDI